MLKKVASGILVILPSSRNPCMLRASNNDEPLRDLASNSQPCWTDFFEHSLQLMMVVSFWHLFAMEVKYSTVPFFD